MNNRIFIPVVGEFANVGDVMHRNELLEWLKPCGEINIYVGKAPQDFIDGLELGENTIMYTSAIRWLWALLFSPFNRTHFVFNSGELTVSPRRLMLELVLFPFLLITKLKRGKVLRVGVAAASNIKIRSEFLWKMIFNFSDLVMWRTKQSIDLFKKGEVIPDLAFAGKLDNCNKSEERINIIVSMRWDRPYPSIEWMKAVNYISNKYSLRILVVSQVRKDNNTCVKLAEDLGGECLLWPKDVDHLEQEERLREIYRQSLISISDRLHVLIAAITEGVIPSVILTKKADKVQHHFDVIGLSNISTMSNDSDSIVRFLEDQLERNDEVLEKLTHGKDMLRLAKDKVRTLLTTKV